MRIVCKNMQNKMAQIRHCVHQRPYFLFPKYSTFKLMVVSGWWWWHAKHNNTANLVISESSAASATESGRVETTFNQMNREIL